MGHSKTEMWQAGWLTIWSFVMSLHQENDHREGLLPVSPGSCPHHSAYFTVVFGRAWTCIGQVYTLNSFALQFIKFLSWPTCLM